jgi:hypothetical protein
MNGTIVFGWFVRHASEGREELGSLGPIVMEIANFPTLVHQALRDLVSRTPMLIENQYPEMDGFRDKGALQEGARKDEGYLLLSAYSNAKKQSTVRLIRIRDEVQLHEWVPDLDRLSKSHRTKGTYFGPEAMSASRFRMLHPLLSDDGGLVFHGEQSPLFKIDACSRMEWVVDGLFHHSLQQGPDGGYWVPMSLERTADDRANPLPFADEAIAKVSPAGELLLTKSVSSILVENGHRGLLYGIRQFGRRPSDLDAFHLNDIGPAQYSTAYWEAGDLLLSIRHMSTVLLYRPSTGKVIWLKTGPWLNQHDADFVGSSRISVFGNDMVRKVDDSQILLDGHNSIYTYDFKDDTVASPYASILRELNVRTEIEGQQRVLENGDAIVDDYSTGRLLRISRSALVWQFVEKVSEKTAAMLSWSRYLTANQVGDTLPRLAGVRCQ